ncbi:hypothetical protein Hokovirus_4_21 [Hokovirus HKV1]|uniref:Uncharacterized protein n=1 Tax=Hokovirus HKV1 TaxID=1977638 RepID=A0A1V0SH61_9VIRU|nr:hypothetical protein Hokovirus_4_21 [Hokovirus HKV1]
MDFEDILKKEIKKEPKLKNRNYVYLQLLEKRLKKFEYLEKQGIKFHNFSSSDNTYLLEQDYSNIKYSNKYKINDWLTKEQTMILKRLLEENLEHAEIFSQHLEKKICVNQEIYEPFEKIKLRYLGFKQYYQIHEYVNNYDINKNYYNYIYCLDTDGIGYLSLENTYLFVFETLEDNYDREYIFYSDFSDRFYKTNEFIKLDYIPIDNFNFQLQFNDTYDKYEIFDLNNNFIISNEYFVTNSYNFLEVNYDYKTDELYTKNTYTKSIQKK